MEKKFAYFLRIPFDFSCKDYILCLSVWSKLSRIKYTEEECKAHNFPESPSHYLVLLRLLTGPFTFKTRSVWLCRADLGCYSCLTSCDTEERTLPLLYPDKRHNVYGMGAKWPSFPPRCARVTPSTFQIADLVNKWVLETSPNCTLHSQEGIWWCRATTSRQ